jgi:tetratricopeptide (TPR) repeat protein
MKYKILALLLIFSAGAFGQNFKAQYDGIKEGGDSLLQVSLLQEWEKAEPRNADMYIAFFNFHIKEGQNEFISIDPEPNSPESMEIQDSTGENTYYLNSRIHYDVAQMSKGIDYLSRGLDLYPSRLDMRFGRIYVLGMLQDYEQFSIQIIELLEYGNTIDFKWKWSNHQDLENPEEMMLSSIQDYNEEIWNTMNDSLLTYMSNISVKVLEYFPDNVVNLSNAAVVKLVQKDYKNALPYLKKANSINPSDYVVHSNLAACYKEMGDLANAKVHYNKMIEFGDDRAQQYAREQIESLKE